MHGAGLHLTWAEGVRYACIVLPAAVDQDDVSARFDKKQHTQAGGAAAQSGGC